MVEQLILFSALWLNVRLLQVCFPLALNLEVEYSMARLIPCLQERHEWCMELL